MAMEKMTALIKKMDDEIKELEKFESFMDSSSTHYYYKNMHVTEGIMKNALWDINLKECLEGMRNFKLLYEELKDRLEKIGINDIDEKIFLMDNIYLSINCEDNNFYLYFYIDKDDYLYDNFYDSHSGLNEWICGVISQLFLECSWASDYKFAAFDIIHDFNRRLYVADSDGHKHAFKVDNKEFVSEIIELIHLTRGDSGYEDAHNYVTEQLKEKMKQIDIIINKYGDN